MIFVCFIFSIVHSNRSGSIDRDTCFLFLRALKNSADLHIVSAEINPRAQHQHMVIIVLGNHNRITWSSERSTCKSS